MAKTGEQNQQFNKLYADFDRQKQSTTELHGELHFKFFDCEKLLVPGVTLHLRFFRSPKNTVFFMKGIDEEAKALDGKVQAIIEKTSLFVRKAVVTDSVELSIEKALVKSSAIYAYIENLNKNFIIQAGHNCFVKKKRVWNGANQKVNLVYGQKFTVSKHSFKLFAFFLPQVQLTACRNTARERDAIGWDTDRHEQQC